MEVQVDGYIDAIHIRPKKLGRLIKERLEVTKERTVIHETNRQ